MLDTGAIAIEWFAVGALLVVLGGLIKYAGWTFLLAGYDQTSAVPDEFVANVAGNTILRVGLATVAVGAIVTVADPPSFVLILFTVIVFLAVARLVYRLNTHAPNESV
jgi:hypothetical protein